MAQIKSQTSDKLPEDIKLNEAGHNWVKRQKEKGSKRHIRHLAADAAIRAHIADAYDTTS